MLERKPKSSQNKRRTSKRLEEIRRFLKKEPEEMDFSQDEFIQKILAPFADFPVEVTRRWAEEWREEHRHSR
ncbi:MAG: hypothetical protein NZ805_13665 [Armatimonadetes bacterium]|nr:hypothetical protein [Armatimonadota bacterium]MDW8027217.1 hypothetical protein [Armatimonadota bacterium]